MKTKEHVIVDTREQKPFTFSGNRITRKALDYGDYSLHGYTRWIRVERKSLNDWLGCLQNKAKRLSTQLNGLRRYRHPLVVVEASIAKKSFWSYLDPWSRCSIMARLLAEFGVPILFCDSRSYAEHAAMKFMKAAKAKIDSEGIV